MSNVRWTDKVYLDSHGNIRDFDGSIINETNNVTYNCVVLPDGRTSEDDTSKNNAYGGTR